MIFAVGARRSGTFWLQRVLTDHPQIAGVPSESHLFSHGVAPLFERLQHSVRSSPQVGRVYVERDVALDAARDLCDAIFAGFLEPGARYLCERTPVHALHLDLIAAIYPDGRFLHIIRDGRDVARSLLVQDFGPDDISGAAAEWRSVVESAREAELPDGAYREIRYERLLAEPERALGEIYRWLGLDASSDVLGSALAEIRTDRNVDQASQHRIATEKWRREFRREDLEAFNRIAGDLISELGYPEADPAELARRPAAGRRIRPPRVRIPHRLRRRRPVDERGRRAATQTVIDDLIAAIIDWDEPALRGLLAPEAVLRVVTADGTEEQARGDGAVELARRCLASDPVFSAPQTRGDVFPSLPQFAIVLTFAPPAGPSRHRALFCELRGGSIGWLTVYLLD